MFYYQADCFCIRKTQHYDLLFYPENSTMKRIYKTLLTPIQAYQVYKGYHKIQYHMTSTDRPPQPLLHRHNLAKGREIAVVAL